MFSPRPSSRALSCAGQQHSHELKHQSALVETWALVDRGRISINGIKKGKQEVCGSLENDKIL